MKNFDSSFLNKIYIPSSSSHKGQNGKLLIIGGSHLFHAASLWALQIASKIVDMVFYASVPENNAIVQKAKEEFRNGIVIHRDDSEDYIKEADCVLIGPGMLRSEKFIMKSEKFIMKDIKDINSLKNEGEQTYYLTKYLLEKYPKKKWVIDAGALQMMDLDWLSRLDEMPILTPHRGEFERTFSRELGIKNNELEEIAKKYNCIILLKGENDTVCSPDECIEISGGNAGMTKGGTGDVLAGLVASLYCKNEAFLSACTGSFINKRAGESLYEKVGLYFNASDLVDEIPKVMKKYISSLK